MNAIPKLQPIESRVVGPGEYDNTRIHNRFAWIRDNKAVLRARYEDLGKQLPEYSDPSFQRSYWRAEEFLAFQLAQYDLALRRHQEGR